MEEKLRILLVNKFLYPRGGDCIYNLNLSKLLKRKGHEVMFLTMSYPLNISLNDEVYLVEEVSFSKKGFENKIKASKRIFGFDINTKISSLLDSIKPDIVHLNNIHSYLSPLIAQIAHRKGMKVIWTLHDYKLICPSYLCLKNGKICELCFRNKLKVVTCKCFKNSYLASALAYLETIYWNKGRLIDWVDTFICPSLFLAEKMFQSGYPGQKIKVLHNFIDCVSENSIRFIGAMEKEEDSYCYIGRLSEEKGIKLLLNVASQLPYKLYIVGDGPLASKLLNDYRHSHLIFLGYQQSSEVIKILKKVRFSVIPSTWYENNPISIIESLCCGTPVLGSNIGGIPEMINKDNNGQLFEPNNEMDLKNKIMKMFSKDYSINEEILSKESLERFSWENYYEKLLVVYNK